MSAQEVKAGEAYIALKTRDTGVAAQTRQAAAKVDEELNRSLARSRAAIAKQVQVDRQKQASSAMRKQMLLTQGAYGLEDAASQFGTMGPLGALRAASNNLSGMLMLSGNLHVALAGIGAIAALQVGTVLAESFDKSKQKAEQLNNQISAIRDNLETRSTWSGLQVDSQQEQRRIANLDSSAAAESTAQSKADQLESLRNRDAELQIAEQKAIGVRDADLRQWHLENDDPNAGLPGAQGAAANPYADPALMQRQKEINEEIFRIQKERSETEDKILAAEKDQKAAAERAAQLRTQEEAHNSTSRQIQLDAQRKTLDQDTRADLRQYDKIESAEAARDELQRLEREQQQHDIDYERQGREADEFKKRKAEAAPEARARWDVDHADEITRMAMERDRTNTAYDNNLAKQAHLRGRMGELSKLAGIASLDSMLGQTNTPTGNRIRIQDETDRQQREIAKLPLPSTTVTRLQQFSQLTGQRRLQDVALQEFAMRNTPTIPQAALMRGSVEATQAAAGNSLAATTTKMAKDIEAMEGRIDEMATDLREFLDQHGKP